MDKYIQWLNELSDFECRIFFYHYVLGFTISRISAELHLNKQKIKEIVEKLQKEKSFLALKEEIFEAFFYE